MVSVMRVERAADSDPVGDPHVDPIYRVRVWMPPVSAGMAWMVDERDVEGSPQVTNVIDWAVAEAGPGLFEIFVRWYDRHIDSDGNAAQYPRYTRVYGRPPEDSDLTVESVVFEAE